MSPSLYDTPLVTLSICLAVAAVGLSSPPAVDPPVVMDTVENAPSVKPTLLLDELFKKTKASPSIYWLPLTELQVCIVYCV